ncbi:hypothetical protein DFH08DRAFT_858095 [Mycena albidolilacea]|uniref:Uncharacterized protein n=1 Tax=Mycena albidolilacea TaxID=1033008 RepID=A0AAD7EU52_9AGAR|nr:hypothetical protein DFH08DRAFT_858095 [Mycena albidolilacea]
MVLEKRKRDGGFEPWQSAGSSNSYPASTPTASSSQIQANPGPIDGLPPAKKQRQEPIPSSQSTPSYPIASSSQSSIPSKPTPAKKIRRKAGNHDDPAPPEKRGAMFKTKCPQNILDRVERVMTQRFFMVDRKRVEGELKEEFKVLGSTGNIYTVTIQQKPSCDCPDAQKGNHCKHILFIYLKVLQVTQSSGHWYQKALLTSELESIFANAPLAPNAIANPRIREAYARATGKSQAPSTPEASASSAPKKRMPGEEDDCPICYDGMHNVAEASLTFCEECGNAVHGECFAQWKQTSKNQSKKLTCIYCRAEWPTPAAPGKSKAGAAGTRTTSGGYINISGVAGLSPQRNTTTYYHGPRRGQRYYGYNEYSDD